MNVNSPSILRYWEANTESLTIELSKKKLGNFAKDIRSAAL
jgi:hypothetical protein